MSAKKFDFSDQKRLVGIALFTFFLFSILVLQFYKVQILEGDKWSKEGQIQHHHCIVEPAMRGRFFSNSSAKSNHPEIEQPFVIDVPKFHLFIDPESIPITHKKEIANQILSIAPLSNEIEEKVQKDIFRKSRSRKILKWLSNEKKEEILKWWLEFAKKNKLAKNALFFSQDYQRSYPFGPLLGQVLHTVLEEKDQNQNYYLPTGGMEMHFDLLLRGKAGSRLMMRSPRHPLDIGKVISPPENGADIYLTINHYLQAITEKQLAIGIQNVGAKGGWAIMMDPKTGEILALAQYPAFDVREYRKYFNDPKAIEHTRIKAVMDAFEPASIFKPITLALCMRANEELIAQGRRALFFPEEKIRCDDGHFPGRSFPLKDGRKHRYLNMYLAIQKSSNIYMGKIMQRMIGACGDKWLKSRLEEVFGFGKKTNIQLPSETPGLVPSPGKMHPNGTLEWSTSTPYSIAIGHNILVNSMQILRVYGLIANNGLDVHPKIVKKIVKESLDGKQYVLKDFMQESAPKRILSEKSCKEIIAAMKFTTKIYGTAAVGDIKGYSEAGKSGTSEKIIDGKYSKQKFLSSFVGFAPAKNPAFVLLVVVDEPQVKFVPGMGKLHHGGVCAAPIFREIGKRALEYLGVAPDDPFGYPYPDVRRDPKKADWSLEVQELRELYRKWNET